MITNRIETYCSLSMRLDLLVKLKYESSTLILFVGIRYFMCDLPSDLSNSADPKLAICYNQVRKMISALPLASAHLSNL